MTYRDDLTAALQRASVLEQKVKELEEARVHDQARIAELEMGRVARPPASQGALREARRRVEELEMQLDELTRGPRTVSRRPDASRQETETESASGARLAFIAIGVCMIFIALQFVCVAS